MLSLPLALLVQTADFQPLDVVVSGAYIGARVRTTDGKEHLFLVDSGSNASYVSQSAVVEEDRRRGSSEIRISVGDAKVFGNAEPVDAKDIQAIVGGLPTEGVLGINILRQLQLEIDYDARSVRARYGSALSWAGPGYSPLLMDRDPDNLYTVTAQIGGKSVRLCLDTGASATVLDPKKVDLSGFDTLPPFKIRTFKGPIESPRYLIESMKVGDGTVPWMIAGAQPWKNADDGIISTAQLGSPRVVVDFPGGCVYVSKPDPMSEAAARILGLPVKVVGDGLSFRSDLTGYFKSSSGAKIVSFRGIKSESIVAALRGHGPHASRALVDAFVSMRAPGLVTTERGGQRQLVPVQVAD